MECTTLAISFSVGLVVIYCMKNIVYPELRRADRNNKVVHVGNRRSVMVWLKGSSKVSDTETAKPDLHALSGAPGGLAGRDLAGVGPESSFVLQARCQPANER
jgi:hypothetical protein